MNNAMNYERKEITYLSSDKKNTVSAVIFVPSSAEISCIVQLSHGMIDYVDRYSELADFFGKMGVVFAGNNHLGHGQTAGSAEDLGFFAEKNGYEFVIDDILKMNEILRKEFPEKPLVLMGHSMGSFIARLYAKKYPNSIDGIIIHGTGGKNPAAPLGRAIVSFLRLLFGARHRSKFVTAVAFGSYNSHYDKAEGHNAWLTRDLPKVANRDTDPYTSYIFTLSGYHDLFTMLRDCNSSSWFEGYPKELPTLVISGEDDPVGDYGKGVRKVHSNLEKAGVKNLTLKLYPNARHELFNELNSLEVFNYLYTWITNSVLKK